MSNHSSDPTDPPDPKLRAYFDRIGQPLGATKEHPRALLTPTDEGGIRFAVGSKNGVVVVDFGSPVAWVGIPSSEARQLAASLIKHADHLDQQQEQKRLERDAAAPKERDPVKFRPTTPDTLSHDLERFADWIAIDMHPTDDEGRADLAKWLNRKLDQLLAMDAFGTEGQCDPRGDHRE